MRKTKSPEKKMRDEVMTSMSKGDPDPSEKKFRYRISTREWDKRF
jgi:hypothetical protein